MTTNSTAKSVLKIMRWSLISAMVAAYLLGCAIAGIGGYEGYSNVPPEQYWNTAQTATTAGKHIASRD